MKIQLSYAAAMLCCLPMPAAASAKTNWVVIPQAPICALGAVFPNDVRFRLEYHPRSDTYHLLVGGRQWANSADGASASVKISSSNATKTLRGRVVRQDPEAPGGVYVSLSQRQTTTGRSGGEWPNDFIEKLMMKRDNSLSIAVDGQPVISKSDLNAAKAIVNLASCADQFAAGGRSDASHRLNRGTQWF